MDRDNQIHKIAEDILDLIKRGDSTMYTYTGDGSMRRVDLDGHIDLIALAEWIYARMG